MNYTGMTLRDFVENPHLLQQVSEKMRAGEPHCTYCGGLIPPGEWADSVVKMTPEEFVDNKAPTCYECGHVMVFNGSIYKCLNCGATTTPTNDDDD